MKDSELVSIRRMSPHWRERDHVIDTITVHHAAAIGVSAAQIGESFWGSRVASSNYGIGVDGEIGLYVQEYRRAITSSNKANDNRAITIEVANSAGAPDWPVSSASWASLILLCTDICKRHGIPKLLWKGDKTLIGQVNRQNMTVHRWFAATACPGDYLYSRMGELAAAVNARLGVCEYENDEQEEIDLEAKRYNTIAQLPEWAKLPIKKLCRLGVLEGHTAEKDANGYPATLDLSMDMIRLLVINERAGIYDAKK